MLFGQPVDARHEDTLDGVRHRDVAHRLALQERTGQLLQEERVSLRLVEDHLRQSLRELGLPQHRVHHDPAVARGEAAQGDLGGVRLVHPARLVARAIGEDQEQGDRRDPLDHRGEEVLGGLVDPVEVLDLQEDQAAAAGVEEDLAQHGEGPRLERLRAELGERLGPLLDVQQAQEIGQGLLGIEIRAREALADPGGDGNRPIPLADPPFVAQHVEERKVRDSGAIGEAAAGEPGRGRAPAAAAELVEEARFARARLARDAHHLSMAALGLLAQLVQNRHLALAADERRQAPAAEDGLIRLGGAEPEQPIRLDQLRLALDLGRSQGLGLDLAMDQPPRRLADQDRARLGDLLQAGRQVRGVAHGGVVGAEVVANAADHDPAGIETHPDLELDAVALAQLGVLVADRLLETQGRQDGAAGVVLVRDRRAEQGHEAVAQELVDGPLVAVDRPQGELEEPVDQEMHDLRSEPLRQPSGPDHVAEDDGDLLALPFQGDPGLQDLLG